MPATDPHSGHYVDRYSVMNLNYQIVGQVNLWMVEIVEQHR